MIDADGLNAHAERPRVARGGARRRRCSPRTRASWAGCSGASPSEVSRAPAGKRARGRGAQRRDRRAEGRRHDRRRPRRRARGQRAGEPGAGDRGHRRRALRRRSARCSPAAWSRSRPPAPRRLAHARAGALAAERVGAAESVIATDVIEALPAGLRAPRERTRLERARGGRRRRRGRAQLRAARRRAGGRAPSSAPWSRPTATATARSSARARRSPAARPGSRSPPRPRRPSCAASFPSARLLVMGALTAAELDVALAAGADVAVWRRASSSSSPQRGRELGDPARASTSSTTAAWAGSASATRTRSRELVERPRRGRPTSSWPGSGPTSRPPTSPTRDFFDEQLERFRAARRAAARASTRRCSCTPRTAPRRCASRASHFDMVRCGIAIYGLDPFQRRPGRARARAGARAALLRRRRQALRAGRQRRLRAHAGARRRTPGSGCCRSATATAFAAG